MWAVCIYAIRRGAWEERTTAIVILLGSYATPLVLSPFSIRFRHVESSILLIDLSIFVVLMFICLKSEKFWPLWLAAMHALTLFSHFSPFVPHLLPWGYYNASAVWIYPMLIVLGLVTYRHHKSRARMGDREFRFGKRHDEQSQQS